MKNILLLGAGLSATNLIKYLLSHAEKYDWHLDIGDINLAMALKKINGHKCGSAFAFSICDTSLLIAKVKKADVVVSFLPARFHPVIANVCLEHKRNMITASYVSEEMKALDSQVRNAGLLFLNELGVDPGIDHMSSMRIIDRIRAKDGQLLTFKSSTGGLIAAESDNNPWNYKFTWNPRNVVLAGQGVSQFIRNGKYKYIPYHKLFERVLTTEILDKGIFEIYPNRNSLKYRKTYSLDNIPTIFRGTIRRPGFCEAWNVFVQLGVTDDTYIIEDSENMTYRDFINSFLRYELDKPVEEKIAEYLGLDPKGEIMQKLQWLGIFEHRKIGLKEATPAAIMQKLLEEKWGLEEDDKDMIVMQHEFIYTLNDKRKRIISSMAVTGTSKEETAMSITVGTPVGIAVKLMLTGRIHLKGVQIPILPAFYNPILDELEDYGVVFIESEEEVGDDVI